MRKSLWLLSAGIFAISAPVAAQETTTEGSPATTAEAPTEAAAVEEPAADEVSDDEIIVTATRRNEALSDVPLAVSAVTGETMQNSGAVDIRGLNQVSPSLLVSSTSSEAGASVARIRGVGTVGDNAGLESSVAVFIDGVYRSRTGTALTELGPVDRVEVLRGPQGTLFGRNASAGLIHVITAKPRFTREIYGEGTLGNYDLRRVELGATGPVTDSLAARIDGIWMQRDGYLDDVIGGGDYNDRNRFLVRGQLLYQPNDDLSVRFIADYAQKNEQCCAAVYQPVQDTVALTSNSTLAQPSTIAFILRNLTSTVDGRNGVILDDMYERKISVTPGRSFNQDVVDYGASVEATYDFGGAELTSISAYRFNDYERGLDADFNNLDILYRDGSGGSANTFKTFTQELRLQGELWGGRLDWLIGGYFAHEKLRATDNLSYGADFEQYANCLAAANLAGALGQPTLLAPGSATCINQTLAGLLIANPGVPAAVKPGLGLLAGLAPGLGGVGGFDAVGLAAGVGMNPFDGVGVNDDFSQTSRNFAVFTHNIFEITRGLKVTLGLRYTRESKDLDMQLADNNDLCSAIGSNPLHPLFALRTIACIIPSSPGGNYSADGNKKESKFSGTAVLSWKPVDSILAYASYSKGYKAGGFNLDRSALLRTGGTGAIIDNDSTRALRFDPELNDAFELGLKYDGPGIDVNIAAFRQDFKDFQLNTFNGINFEVENINSCSGDLGGADQDNSGATGDCDLINGKVRSGVRSTGIEFEIFTRPFRDANFNLGITYADTRYRDNLVGAGGEPISAQLFQLANRHISNSSELVTTASFSWAPPIGSSGMRGLFYIDGRQMSDFNTGSDLDIEKRQKGFGVINGRIGLHGANNRWGVEVWGMNLLDTKFKQVAFDMPLQGSCTTRGAQAGFCSPTPNRSTQLFGAFLGEPRTFGVTIRGKM